MVSGSDKVENKLPASLASSLSSSATCDEMLVLTGKSGKEKGHRLTGFLKAAQNDNLHVGVCQAVLWNHLNSSLEHTHTKSMWVHVGIR